MKIEDVLNTVICGDALAVLKTLPDESINSVITSPPYFNLRSYLPENHKNKKLEVGLETTYQKYIAKLIAVFNEVKRVLKKDGTCFVNLGDTFSGSGGAGGDYNVGGIREGQPKYRQNKSELLAKCLMMIPERFAIAMIENGFILRNKLIWIKKNSMPESINDRWKKAHEYIFFFVKSNTTQFWTHSKTKERVDKKPRGINGIEGVDWEWQDCPNCNATKGETKINSEQAENFSSPMARYHRQCNKKRCVDGKIKRSLWDSHDYYFDLDAIRTPYKEVSLKRAEYEQGRNALGINPSSMGKKYLDNKRYLGMPARMVKLNEKGACPPDYLEVNTNCSEKDGSSDHYASYPLNLIYPLIKAGSKKGDVILDPFGGSMTTCVAAKQLRRNYIAIDLNPKYIEIGKKRLAFPKPML